MPDAPWRQKVHKLQRHQSQLQQWASGLHVASDLLVNIRVSLNDGVAPGLVPLDRSVHHAHAKANIEHVAMASSSRADGLHDENCRRSETRRPSPSQQHWIRPGSHWPAGQEQVVSIPGGKRILLSGEWHAASMLGTHMQRTENSSIVGPLLSSGAGRPWPPPAAGMARPSNPLVTQRHCLSTGLQASRPTAEAAK